MAGPRVVSVLYCVAFAAAATASHADGSATYEQIPLGAIFEQGSDEVQNAFKLAVFRHNKNNTDRRFEIQAYVDVIKTADAFKLSKLNVGAKLVAMNEEKRTDCRAVKSVSNGSTKKSRSWRSRLFRKKPLTDNKDRTVETTTGNSVSGKARSRKMSSKMSSKKIKNAKKMSTAALATELLSSPTSSFEFATKTTVGRGEKQRPAARLVRMVPVTVTQAQEQTTADKSLTLPCKSFTPNTVQRPKIGPTTDRRQPRTWSCSQTPQINVLTESSGSTGRTINVAAATLPTCVNRLAVDGAAADEDPMTKGFMKITSTERWTTTEIA